MLQTIRERAQGWFSWVIVIAICVPFALWGIDRFNNGSAEGKGKVLAEVNGVSIYQNQVSNLYNRLINQARNQLGDKFVLTPSMSQLLKKNALEQLISMQALSHEAKESGFFISDAQIKSQLASNPLFQINGVYSPERFQNVLAQLNFTQAGFMHTIANASLIGQVRTGILGTAFALPYEAKEALALISETRDVAYDVVPAKSYEGKINITPKEVKQYYNANKVSYETPAKVKIAYILLDANKLAKKIKPTNEEIKNYYDNNLTNFTKPAKYRVAYIVRHIQKADKNSKANAEKTLAKVVSGLQKGESFAKLAKAYSQDPSSADKGGMMPWVTGEAVGQQFYNTIKGLKVGQISQPVMTRYGLCVIKLIAKKAEQVTPLAKVRKRIIGTIQAQSAQKAFSSDSDILANKTFEKPNTLAPAAKALGLKIQETTYFTRKGTHKGITSNSKVVQTAFNDDVINNHNNSDVVQLNDNQSLVLRAVSYKAKSVKPLTEVKNEIIAKLKYKKADAKIKASLEHALHALQAGQKMGDVASRYDLSWHYSTNTMRHDTALDPNIVNAAFALPKPRAKQTYSYGVVPIPQKGYAIIAISHVKPGDTSKMKAQMQTFQDESAGNNGSIAYSLYVNAALKSADVKRKA